MAVVAVRLGDNQMEMHEKKLYLAPMEGLTGYVFRNAYEKHFRPMEKYFTPFIASTGFSSKEKREVKPENNVGKRVVPQILTNHVEDFLFITDKLKALGYGEVNLNLGCPSGTVVSKGRGAGFLEYPYLLHKFLEEIYSKSSLPVSLKIRIGISDEDEWPQLRNVFLDLPIHELIVHPRLRNDFYDKPVHLHIFADALLQFREAGIPVVYNGDIHNLEQYNVFVKEFSSDIPIMLGRGILKNPNLAQEIDSGKQIQTREEYRAALQQLFAFHDDLLQGYREELDTEKALLFKMKEVWVYLGERFPGFEKEKKLLLKAKNISELISAKNVIYSGALSAVPEFEVGNKKM